MKTIQDFMPPGIDGNALLIAIAMVETEGGRNNCPRFEVAYIPKGERFTVQGRVIEGTGACVNSIVLERWQKWGLASAASYGPWQILYHTAADRHYRGCPWGLWSQAGSRPFVVAQLERIVCKGARSIEEVADAWNSGNHFDQIVPHRYIAKVVAEYKRQLKIRPAVAGRKG